MMDAPTERSALHGLLRDSTRQAHRTLDRHPIMVALMRDGLTTDQYGDALAALHGIYTTLEHGIFCFVAEHPETFSYRPDRKLPALEADLADLGRSPYTPPMPTIGPATLAEWIGTVYVVEGSGLGGLSIAAQIRRHSTLPVRFFSGEGIAVVERWRQFLAFSDRVLIPDTHGAAAEQAVDVFAAITTYFDGVAPL